VQQRSGDGYVFASICAIPIRPRRVAMSTERRAVLRGNDLEAAMTARLRQRRQGER
jgi:hypothetical protein